MPDADHDSWPQLLYDLLVEAGVSLFAHVPDAGNTALIRLADAGNETRSVLLSTEDEGVAVCAGADLVGARAVVCMQSSGVGNCPNMLSLVTGGRFPMLMVVSMRGDYGEMNPWQYPMGRAVEPVLKAMGILTIRVERADEFEQAARAAIAAAFSGGQGVALILSQKFLGAKVF